MNYETMIGHLLEGGIAYTSDGRMIYYSGIKECVVVEIEKGGKV